ncbi:glycosyltransferase family 87 protein [Roseivirga thermotolerans]|uniref:glycosyltransferase family 87 protein n=1 Tax=Roseivirga thermotolerans TaxID=1758176 RepID=UPI00273FA49C|nr:glycosyltransferase family 87 protein [Roseivirga thermotolerans]
MKDLFNQRQRIYLYIILTLLSIGFTTQQAADYRIYIAAGRVMIDQRANPYADADMVETEPDGIVTPHAQYRYAPIFGIALYPISLLPKQFYIFLWLFFNAFLVVKTLVLYKDFFPKLLDDTKAFFVVSGIALFLCIRLIGQNFELGQTTIILVFLSFYSLYLSKKNKDILAGLMLGLAIVTKIMPLVLIAYFVFRGNLKTPMYTVLWVVILVLLPALFVGWEYNNFLIKEWYGIINPMNSEYTLETKTGIYNLSAFIYAYLTEMPDDRISGSRNIMSISYELAGTITNVVRVLLVLLTLHFTKWTPFKRLTDWKQLFWEFGYISFAFPLIFPAQNKYSFYYIFPVLFYLSIYLYYTKEEKGSFWKTKKSILIPIIIYFVLTNLTSSNIIGKTLYDQTQFYKVMTFGIVALLIAYIQVKPSMLDSKSTED